jgi:hypothetical protein
MPKYNIFIIYILLILGGQLGHVTWSNNSSTRESGRASSGDWACVLSILAQTSDKTRVELIDGQREIGQVFGQDILKMPTWGDFQSSPWMKGSLRILSRASISAPVRAS